MESREENLEVIAVFTRRVHFCHFLKSFWLSIVQYNSTEPDLPESLPVQRTDLKEVVIFNLHINLVS